jgi:GT2 family glycosyltransferase
VAGETISSDARISVVICAYSDARWAETLAAVASVQAQTLAPAEIVVVVDHNPVLRERLAKDLVDVRVVDNAYPQGLSGGKNTGIDSASYEFVAFLDDDAVAEVDWLEHLAASCSGRDILGAGGRTEPIWDAPRPTWFPEEFLWTVGATSGVMPKEVAPVRNVFGGNSCWRRSVFATIGGFDTAIGAGAQFAGRSLACEETELCIRANKRFPGQHFVFDPNAVIRHHVTAERTRFRYFRKRCFNEGLSKAFLSRRVGHDAGLAAERSHVWRVLPRAVGRGVVDGFRGDVNGIRRGAAIVFGTVVTIGGFVRGRLARWT